MNYEVCKGNHMLLGVTCNGTVTNFAVVCKGAEECKLVLYPKNGGRPEIIPMEKTEEQHSIYSIGIKNLIWENYDYRYEADGKELIDPYAATISGREKWGDTKRKEIKCGLNKMENFQWGGDKFPCIAKQDMVIYKLHVRGFSMLQKLPDAEKGTFRGVEKKLSYLKEMGVTTVEFMPIYEFEEMFAKDTFQRESFPVDKINYWGYTRGNYFALKAAYLGEGNTAKVFKQLVRSMHRKGMECIPEFYFDDKLNPHYILDILRYWVKEYHVDGFHVICKPQIAELIAVDYHLAGRKLFFEWFSEEFSQSEQTTMQLFSYNDAFLYGVRKLINQQGGTVQEFADNMRRQQKSQGFVNYLATNNGFNLYDMLAYSEKHNQANGEENRDGIVWNFSSNCGEEGATRKKPVNQLRIRQIKNALCALMFGQGVPLVWMGDESGNSQQGNNNPYCQDNEISWRRWDMTKRNRELTQFFKKLTELRRCYPALRSPIPMEMADYKRTGYPDLSYHSSDGWRMELSGSDKAIGMMYSSGYGQKQMGEEKLNEEYIYVGYNFSLLSQQLALPALPRKYRWYYVLDTGREENFVDNKVPKYERTFEIQSQSVCMLIGKKED